MQSGALIIVAATGEEFVDFAPYVPSIDNLGRVAFQAGLCDGGHAICVFSESGPAQPVIQSSSQFPEFISHPDINDSLECCFYAKAAGGEGVLLLGGQHNVMARGDIGPLGPTMNALGDIAYRVSDSGREEIRLSTAQGDTVIAMAGEGFASFQGLPVVNDKRSVCFRADLADGRQGIYLWDMGTVRTIAETGAEFGELGRFPSLNDSGCVGFVDPGRGVFVWEVETHCVHSGMESYRGVLLHDEGFVHFGTPAGGTMGVYLGDERVLGMGDSFAESTISEFALNPVSINGRGQIAARVKLEDGRQMIVRVDP